MNQLADVALYYFFHSYFSLAIGTSVKRYLPLIPALALLLVALWSTLGQLSFLRDSTSPDDWSNAAHHALRQLEKNTQSKDSPTRVMVWPEWRETPLPHLVDQSQYILWNHAPTIEDLQNTSEIIILTPQDRKEDALRALPFTPQNTRQENFNSVLALHVALPPQTQYTTPPLHTLLRKATVSIEKPKGKPTSCTSWRNNPREPGWACAKHPRIIGAAEYELDDQPRTCILAHPPKSPSDTLVITFPKIKTELDHATLRVRAGIDLRGARLAKHNDDLTLEILQGDQSLATHTYKAQESTWDHLDIPLKTIANHTIEPLTFRVSAKSHDHKLFCFNAWVLPQ